jgi:hypothetical protein
MHNKNVLLGVTGRIAAYKSAELVCRLREAGARVLVVMTEAAKEFPLMSKKQLAHKLIHFIAGHIHAKNPVKNSRSKNR